jgi:hypothetical protein
VGYEALVQANNPFNAQPVVTLAPQMIACSAGKTPVGGGYELVGTGEQLTVLASEPYISTTSAGWRVSVRNNTTQTLMQAQVRMFVTCVAAPPQ